VYLLAKKLTSLEKRNH